MISELANHLWQSTVFTAAVAILVFAFRRNRARVRYWLWFTASMKFLVPFAPLIAVGGQVLSWMRAAESVPPSLVFSAAEMSQPLLDSPVSVAAIHSATRHSALFVAMLLGAWASGFMVVAFVRIRTWRRIRRTATMATSMTIASIDIPAHVRVKAVPSLMEPGVVGIWRHTLLLPMSIDEHLTRPQLRTVIAHELWHVRYRDNLTAAIHMVVEAIWWFHPAVWLIGSRLIDERERACDEAVLTTLRKPRVYAEAILNVCKFYIAAPPRSVAGVSSANLRTRVAEIMAGRTGSRLSPHRKIALVTVTVAALTLPITIGAARTLAQVASGQPIQQNAVRTGAPVAFEVARPEALTLETSPVTETATAPATIRRQLPNGATPTVAATAATTAPAPARPQGRADGSTPRRFEVVSIRPNRDSTAFQKITTEPGGRFIVQNFPLRNVIEVAYGISSYQLLDAPAWIQSERYNITALTGRDEYPSVVQMRPLIQSLLADRFQLQTVREVRVMQTYVLTRVRPDALGPNMHPVNVDCTSPERRNPVLNTNACGTRGSVGTATGTAVTMPALARLLDALIGTSVTDETGLSGQFDLTLKWSPDDTASGGDRASIFTAVQEQLGLTLEPRRTVLDMVAVKRIERPTEN